MLLTRHIPAFRAYSAALCATPSCVCGVVAGHGAVAVPDRGAAVSVFASGVGSGEVVGGDPAYFGVGDAEAACHGELGCLCEVGVAETEDGCEEGEEDHDGVLFLDIWGEQMCLMWCYDSAKRTAVLLYATLHSERK